MEHSGDRKEGWGCGADRMGMLSRMRTKNKGSDSE